MAQNLVFTNDVTSALNTILDTTPHNRVAVIVDENTRRCVLPEINSPHLRDAAIITIGAGDACKNLNTLSQVWEGLQACGATRKSIVVNLGGGVVTDLGGFAAATFKRGIKFVNVPTTLLSAVDAAVGGKTGINFGGLKNEIGCFQEATHVVISTCFFSTLPVEELKSGYAEMLKHGMLSGEEEFRQLLDFDFEHADAEQLLQLLRTSVLVKQRIVAEDPHEKGIRRALNLGHTVGHAFESKALHDGKPIAHGYAVAWGLVAEMVLSHNLLGFSSAQSHQLAEFVYHNYGAFHITCDHYEELLHLMQHDKKSEAGEINCTLLAACGDVKPGQVIPEEEMRIALDIYRDLMHI